MIVCCPIHNFCPSWKTFRCYNHLSVVVKGVCFHVKVLLLRSNTNRTFDLVLPLMNTFILLLESRSFYQRADPFLALIPPFSFSLDRFFDLLNFHTRLGRSFGKRHRASLKMCRSLVITFFPQHPLYRVAVCLQTDCVCWFTVHGRQLLQGFLPYFFTYCALVCVCVR